VELLLVLGVLSLLLGFTLPSLRAARAKADAANCMIEMHQLSMMIHEYSIDSRDSVPFIYERNTRSNQWIAPTGQPLPGPAFFSTAADYWALPMIDDLGNNFLADPLLCPNDVVTQQTAEELATSFNQPIGLVFPPLERSISRAFYFAPKSLANDLPRVTTQDNRVARLSDTRFPSRKSLLVEDTPFHHESYFPIQPSPVPPPYSLVVTACDGSTMLRPIVDSTPAVLVGKNTQLAGTHPNPVELHRNQSFLGAFHYTRDGVHGLDW